MHVCMKTREAAVSDSVYMLEVFGPTLHISKIIYLNSRLMFSVCLLVFVHASKEPTNYCKIRCKFTLEIADAKYHIFETMTLF